jgi:hypothetical protein
MSWHEPALPHTLAGPSQTGEPIRLLLWQTQLYAATDQKLTAFASGRANAA